MLPKPSIDLLKHKVRRAICPECKFRPPSDQRDKSVASRQCEQTCPIFHHLDELREHALQAEPMFSRKRALVAQIKHFNASTPPDVVNGRRQAPSNPLIAYGERVAELIACATDC